MSDLSMHFRIAYMIMSVSFATYCMRTFKEVLFYTWTMPWLNLVRARSSGASLGIIEHKPEHSQLLHHRSISRSSDPSLRRFRTRDTHELFFVLVLIVGHMYP